MPSICCSWLVSLDLDAVLLLFWHVFCCDLVVALAASFYVMFMQSMMFSLLFDLKMRR